MAKLISEPSAVIGGSSAYLLSRVLTAPPVAAYLRSARWTHGDDFGRTLAAVHEAGRVWQASLELRQRQDASRCELSPPDYATMTAVEETSERLGISRRRVQELARSGRITGRRVGRRWQLDPYSVNAYRRRNGSS